MISKVTIAGIPVLVTGLILLILFTIVGVIVPPFGNRTNTNYGNDAIDQVFVGPSTAETIDLHLEGIPSHPTQVYVKARFIFLSAGSYQCNIRLLFSGSVEGSISGDYKTITGPESEERIISATVPIGYSSQSYSIKLDIENTGPNSITVSQRLIEVRFSLYSTYLPALFAIIGLILTILGFTVFKGGPSAPKQKKAVTPGGWEPTLQWGGGSSTSPGTTTGKKPKMAIKSTKAKSGQKKVVKKVVSKGGAQQSCKFCGKGVPASAFFCPHCYGKLR